MKINYVTISREYGSGGREVGRKLADNLGIPLYDKEIIEQTAFKTGFAEDYVKRQGEYASARNWIEYSFSARKIDVKSGSGLYLNSTIRCLSTA